MQKDSFKFSWSKVGLIKPFGACFKLYRSRKAFNISFYTLRGEHADNAGIVEKQTDSFNFSGNKVGLLIQPTSALS